MPVLEMLSESLLVLLGQHSVEHSSEGRTDYLGDRGSHYTEDG
jgi:hypothetical protein